jgi:hypothetical protein
MEPEGLLLPLQVPATCPYPEPACTKLSFQVRGFLGSLIRGAKVRERERERERQTDRQRERERSCTEIYRGILFYFILCVWLRFHFSGFSYIRHQI